MNQRDRKNQRRENSLSLFGLRVNINIEACQVYLLFVRWTRYTYSLQYSLDSEADTNGESRKVKWWKKRHIFVTLQLREERQVNTRDHEGSELNWKMNHTNTLGHELAAREGKQKTSSEKWGGCKWHDMIHLYTDHTHSLQVASGANCVHSETLWPDEIKWIASDNKKEIIERPFYSMWRRK